LEHSEEEHNNKTELLSAPKGNSLADTDLEKEKDMKISQSFKLKEDTTQQTAEHIENIKNYFKLAKINNNDKVKYIKL
jgi:hypothetical protein